MRATLDTLTRDTRVGGACLPTDGQFIALEGTDGAEGDAITIRAGIFEDQTCVVTTLTEAAPVGGTEVEVEDGAVGFRPEMITRTSATRTVAEQLLEIAAAEGVGLGFNEGLVQNFPVGSSVYAVEERTYALDRSDPDNPILTLTIDRGAPRPFAGGLQDLQVRYLLDRNCLPASGASSICRTDTAEWRIVHSVLFTATVRPPQAVQAVSPAQPDLVATSAAKVRNLLP